MFFLFIFLCLLDSTPFYKIMVPTVDTVRYDFLVYSLLQAKRPVLLTGPVGTGKTSLAQKVLQRLDPKIYSLLVINMSAQVRETQHLCMACSFPVTFDSNTMKLVQQEIKPSHIRMSQWTVKSSKEEHVTITKSTGKYLKSFGWKCSTFGLIG